MMSKSDRTATKRHQKHKTFICAFCAFLWLIVGVGCRRDMQDQPKVKPLRGSTFFSDGLGSRPPIEGTIPRGYLRSDTAFFTGKKTGLANTPGAKKAVRKIARRTEVNKARRSRVRTYLRRFEEAVAAGDATKAKAAFVEAQSELMRAVTKGVVHKNTGSRKVSRLAAQLKKLSAA